MGNEEQAITTTNYIQVIPNTIFSTNDYLACKPFVSNTVQSIQGNSVASLMSQVDNLKSLEVLFPDETQKFSMGDKVYLRKDAYEAPFIKAVFYFNNMPFILVPKSMVVLHEKYYVPTLPTVTITNIPSVYPSYPEPPNGSYTITWTTKT